MKTSVGAAWALRQMRELVKLGVDVHVALPDGGPLVPQYAAGGVVVHPLQVDLAAYRPGSWRRLFACTRNLVASVKPDIIHSHFVGTTATMRLALGKKHPVPRIFQVPGPLHLEHMIYRNAEIAMAGPRDFWVASCQWTRHRYIHSGIRPERVFLSYYGTDLSRFRDLKRGNLRRELGLDGSQRIAGMVAFMYPPKLYLGQTRGVKGHEDLIDAMALCRNAMPGLVCILVGGAWNGASEYEERVRAYGKKKCGNRVVFLGTREDVPQLYPDFDVAVHPSHSENLGAAGESLLLGIPTIATKVGGFPDLVIDGETGWLVPPRDPFRLAAAIQEALNQPEHAREIAMKGRDRAMRLLDVEQTAHHLYGFYCDILSTQQC